MYVGIYISHAKKKGREMVKRDIMYICIVYTVLMRNSQNFVTGFMEFVMALFNNYIYVVYAYIYIQIRVH